MLTEGVLFIGSAVAVSVLAQWLVDQVAPRERRAPYNDVAGYLFTAVGAFYGILLAFVVVSTWDAAGRARDNTYTEANALPGIYFSSNVFPEHREEFQAIVVSYASNVITEEWPALAAGRSSPAVDADAQRLRRELLSLQPETGAQVNVHAAMIERINAIGSARRTRLNDANPSISPPFWTALVCGGVLVVCVTLFFGTPRLLPMLLMIAVLATIVFSSLYLAHAMDHPFRGAMSLDPEAFRTALRQMGHDPP